MAVPHEKAILIEALREALVLGAIPEIAYNSITAADSEIIGIAPPSGHYVYLITITGNVGSSGDVIEAQVLDKTGTWRTFLRLKLLGNTSMVWGAPNLKLDKVYVGGVSYEVAVGDGSTKTFRLMSRGSGPWEATVLYYTGE